LYYLISSAFVTYLYLFMLIWFYLLLCVLSYAVQQYRNGMRSLFGYDFIIVLCIFECVSELCNVCIFYRMTVCVWLLLLCLLFMFVLATDVGMIIGAALFLYCRILFGYMTGVCMFKWCLHDCCCCVYIYVCIFN
jgi:hypothetical protein